MEVAGIRDAERIDPDRGAVAIAQRAEMRVFPSSGHGALGSALVVQSAPSCQFCCAA